MGAVSIVAVVAAVLGWTVFDALRNRRWMEALGLVVFAGLVVGVILADATGQPRRVTDVLIGLGFVVGTPLTWSRFHRQWQAFKGALPPSRS